MLSRRTLPMVLYLGNVSRDDAIAAMPKLKSGEDVVGNVNTHNHAADPCRKETLQIKNAIKRRAIDTDETAQLLLTVLKQQQLSYHHYAISDVVFDELRRMLETQYLYPRT